jgi:2-polyprenyl-6-methoxyphenol hydroxylase-like FAD-dependent oxidoreductase
MTPNLGQGGCQALEDAAMLAHHASGGTSLASAVPDALVAYTADRRPRATKIVRRSRAAGRPQEWSSPLAVALRNRGIRLTSLFGLGLMIRQLRPVFAWTPPQPDA